MKNKKQTMITMPGLPDELFTDRQEYLNYFYEEALLAATQRSASTVLLGQRRMGKTEIFRRVVNRLFDEQDPNNPKAIVPVYYNFEDIMHTPNRFAIDYLENFSRYYVAFYLRDTEIIIERYSGEALKKALESAKSTHPSPDSFRLLQDWLTIVELESTVYPQSVALQAPGRIAFTEEIGVAVFLDEFQNVRMPHQNNFDLVGFFQDAVVTPYAPHFVTGSAVGILVRDIIGVGPLFGRFWSKPIKPLSDYWGEELVTKACTYYGVPIEPLIAPVLSNRCGGNPFYIHSVVRQAAKLRRNIMDEEAINNLLAVDISSGFIWSELLAQVNSWIRRINDKNITKWILYLSALEEEEEISLERIQQELKKREGTHIELDHIRDVLVRLSDGDLLEYLQFGDWFRKMDDPILVDFLRVWGRVEVERQNREQVQNEITLRYDRIQRTFNEYKGYLAEVFMAQVLLSSYEFDAYPGHFFNSESDIPIRAPVIFVNHRVRPRSGAGNDIDILASIGGHMWVCQSKWVVDRKMSVKVVQELLDQAAYIQTKDNPRILYKWLFAHNGLTDDALKLAEKENVFWSTREQLDNLMTFLGLRKLPKDIAF
ncbi:MAG: hypothetical protein AAF639_37040 [Chloroflexota bacterium]